MTLREMQAYARAKGVSLRFSADCGEYRVTYPQARYQALGASQLQARERMEAQAYYTDDRLDALGMVDVMARTEPTL